MANARGKEIDTTYLSIEQAEQRGFIHRDYIAHCLRWSHVIKFMAQSGRYQDARILDIGCGKETPLAKTMYTSKMSPVDGYYIGVDYGKIPHQEIHDKMSDKFEFHVCENVNSATDIKLVPDCLEIKNLGGLYDLPNIITCFEVLEHMEPELVVRTLKNIKDILDEDGTVFITTPCFNGKAAANHVNEMGYEGLHMLLLNIFNFELKAEYGTFASQSDYKPQMTPAQLEMFDSLSKYYDSNLVSVIFAPLFPGHSRNTMYVLGKGKSIDLDVLQLGINNNSFDDVMKSNSDKSWTAALEVLKELTK